MDEYIRFSGTLIAALVTTTRTTIYAFDEVAVALFTLPAHPRPRLPPNATSFDRGTLDIGLALSFGIAGIPMRPLAQLGRVSRALCAAHVLAVLADGSGSRNKIGLALVAAAADALLDMAIDPLVAGLVGHGQEALLLASFGGLLGLLLLLQLGLLGRRPILRVAGTLLAALVVALGADLVSTVAGAAVMAAAVDAHADGLLDALDGDGLGRGRDPFVGFQSETIFGKQGTSTFLLKGSAVHLLGLGSDRRSESWLGGVMSGRTDRD